MVADIGRPNIDKFKRAIRPKDVPELLADTIYTRRYFYALDDNNHSGCALGFGIWFCGRAGRRPDPHSSSGSGHRACRAVGKRPRSLGRQDIERLISERVGNDHRLKDQTLIGPARISSAVATIRTSLSL